MKRRSCNIIVKIPISAAVIIIIISINNITKLL